MSVQRMCQLAELPRPSFYRWQPGKQRPDADLELRDTIQRIALEFPSYGRPRITAELRRRGWVINPKKVQRILREDNLLCLRRRKFVLTTDSGHGLAVYPNLARERVLSGLDQLWVADITYIRLAWEFVYLAVILDAYSRRVVGWALEDTLEGKLTIAALRMALRRRRPGAGLVHHSDRGVQYAAHGYVDLLKQHERGHQYEPQSQPLGQCQSGVFHEDAEVRRGLPLGVPRFGRGARFDWALSREGVQREALAFGVGLLSAGGVRAEPACPASGCGGSGGRSFLRHGEIFRSDRGGWGDAGRKAVQLYAPPHRLDEFPAGYSLAGCSPAGPAAASPAGNHYARKGRRWPSKTSERSTVSKLFVSPQGASPIGEAQRLCQALRSLSHKKNKK